MKVEIRLSLTLRRLNSQKEESTKIDLPVGARIAKLKAEAGIPKKERVIVLVNGRPAKDDTTLKDGDVVIMFPPVEGG